jgi:hypothetical protein
MVKQSLLLKPGDLDELMTGSIFYYHDGRKHQQT